MLCNNFLPKQKYSGKRDSPIEWTGKFLAGEGLQWIREFMGRKPMIPAERLTRVEFSVYTTTGCIKATS